MKKIAQTLQILLDKIRNHNRGGEKEWNQGEHKKWKDWETEKKKRERQRIKLVVFSQIFNYLSVFIYSPSIPLKLQGL